MGLIERTAASLAALVLIAAAGTAHADPQLTVRNAGLASITAPPGASLTMKVEVDNWGDESSSPTSLSLTGPNSTGSGSDTLGQVGVPSLTGKGALDPWAFGYVEPFAHDFHMVAPSHPATYTYRACIALPAPQSGTRCAELQVTVQPTQFTLGDDRKLHQREIERTLEGTLPPPEPRGPFPRPFPRSRFGR